MEAAGAVEAGAVPPVWAGRWAQGPSVGAGWSSELVLPASSVAPLQSSLPVLRPRSTTSRPTPASSPQAAWSSSTGLGSRSDSSRRIGARRAGLSEADRLGLSDGLGRHLRLSGGLRLCLSSGLGFGLTAFGLGAFGCDALRLLSLQRCGQVALHLRLGGSKLLFGLFRLGPG